MSAEREGFVERVDDDRRRSLPLSRAPPAPWFPSELRAGPTPYDHARAGVSRASRPRVRVHEALSSERRCKPGPARVVVYSASPNDPSWRDGHARTIFGRTFRRPTSLAVSTPPPTDDESPAIDDFPTRRERPRAKLPRSLRFGRSSSRLVSSRRARAFCESHPSEKGWITKLDDLRAGEITR